MLVLNMMDIGTLRLLHQHHLLLVLMVPKTPNGPKTPNIRTVYVMRFAHQIPQQL